MLSWARTRGILSRQRLPIAVCAAVALLVGTGAVSWATHLSTEVEGHTTVDETICARDPAGTGCLPAAGRDKSAYYRLQTAPGEPYLTRELSPGAPIGQAGREQRRT